MAPTKSHLAAFGVFPFVALVGADGGFDLLNTDAYKDLRDCSKHHCYGFDKPLDFSSCKMNRVNSCVCRSDLQDGWVSAMSSCVKSACANTRDIDQATSIYLDYCKSAGYTRAAPVVTVAATSPQATQEPSTITAGTMATVGAPGKTVTTVVMTITASSSSSSLGASECLGLLLLCLVSLHLSTPTTVPPWETVSRLRVVLIQVGCHLSLLQ